MESDLNITWQQASSKCKAENGELAVVETISQKDIFYRRILLSGGITPQEPKIYIGEYNIQNIRYIS
jgi:hypothetical protein